MQVTVRVPGRDEDPAEVDVATVEPDGRTVLLVTVRNQSGVVESYSLRIQGLPDGWYAVTPDVVHLVPFGAESGDYEASLELTITPPRSPEFRAGVWPIEVVAVTHPDGRPVGASPARIVIGASSSSSAVSGPSEPAATAPCVSPSPCETSATPRCHCGSVPRTPRTRCPSPSTLRDWRSAGEDAHAMVTATARQPTTGSSAERRLTVFVDAPGQTLSGNVSFVQRPRATAGRLTLWRVLAALLGPRC